MGIMINIRNLDFRNYTVISMLVLWASLTFSIALTEIAFVSAFIFWIGWHIQLKKGLCQTVSSGGKSDWVFWTPLALFFLSVLISFFTSEYPKQSFRGLFKIAKPLLAFMMAIDLFGDTQSQKRFRGIFLGTFLLVLIDCSIQYAFGKDILRGFAAEQSAAGIRLVGPFGNFAKMATYLVLVVPVFGMRFWSDFTRPEHRKKSFYSLGLAIAGFVLLYLTRCRAPVVALVLSSGLLFIYKRWFKVLGIALLLCLALLAIAPRGVIIHQDAQGKEQSIVERFELWKRALDVVEAKPWTGTGINTYNVAHEKYDKEQNWRVRGYYAHNGYLQLTAEIGLPGIFFFLLFLLMFFRRILGGLGAICNSPEEYARLGLLTGLLAFLIYAAADNNLQSPPSLMFFWFTAGILFARQNSPAENAANVPNVS
jgi:putative inorganic carbon (hco3(-)) transporter